MLARELPGPKTSRMPSFLDLFSGVTEHFDGALDGEGAALTFQAVNFVEGLGGKVAFATVGTIDHRDVLDDQQVFALAMCFCDVTEARAVLAAQVTSQLLTVPILHNVYTVMTTSLPVGLNFATTSTGR